MSTERQTVSPTASLASQIVDALCREALIPAAKRDELLPKLQSGRITAQDWRVLIELALPRKQGSRRDAAAR